MMTSPSPSPVSRDQHLWSLLPLAFEIGYVIAIPAVLFGFGGAFLDGKYGTSPVFVLIGFVFAFAASAYVVFHRVRSVLKKL